MPNAVGAMREKRKPDGSAIDAMKQNVEAGRVRGSERRRCDLPRMIAI
jgi:hypothetical protein